MIDDITFTIPGRLDGLNEYTKACRKNKYAGSDMKRKNQKLVERTITQNELKPVSHEKLSVFVEWYEPNSRRDIDNITFAVKFILDALVKKGIIVDDSQRYITHIQHEVYVDKKNPRITVTLKHKGE